MQRRETVRVREIEDAGKWGPQLVFRLLIFLEDIGMYHGALR